MHAFTLGGLLGALEEASKSEEALLGLGVRAFPRFGPGLLLKDYRILCARFTADLEAIRAFTPVECLEEDVALARTECRDTHALLSHIERTQRDLLPAPGAGLLVYQDSPGLHQMAEARGWRLLANSFDVRMRWENKAWFRSQVKAAGFHVPRSLVCRPADLTSAKFPSWQKSLGRELVLQIPDFPRGGGRATFLVRNRSELGRLLPLLKEGLHRGHPFDRVLISCRINGPSLSMEGCVTRKGVICSSLQTQLVDLPKVLPPRGWGRFCGHQWGEPEYPRSVEQGARDVTQWVGSRLRSEGYKGIFCVDFSMDRLNEHLYALECNPRYTGAFPALTLLQHGLGQPPLEGFHLLTWMGGDFSASIEDVNDALRGLPTASQLLLFHRGHCPAELSGDLTAGRYIWDEDLREARRLGAPLPVPAPPWNPMEFCILDGPPRRKSRLLPGDELDVILRVLFFRPICRDASELDPYAVTIVDWIYRNLGIQDA